MHFKYTQPPSFHVAVMLFIFAVFNSYIVLVCNSRFAAEFLKTDSLNPIAFVYLFQNVLYILAHFHSEGTFVSVKQLL